MAKHGKGGHHEEEMGEAWLLPYSDLMTLLLAVFIVLFAVSQVDEEKLAEMAKAFQGLYSGATTIIVGVGPGETVSIGGAADPNAPIIDIWAQFPQVSGGEGEGDGETKEEKMENFSEALKTYFAQNNMSNDIHISDQPSMLTLTLASDVLFPLGSARLNDSQREIARDVAAIIYDTQRRGLSLLVEVHGHTDNIPIRTAQYASNWNLSLDRASNFLAAMIDGSELDPRTFSAVGHGEMDPVDTNETAEGRQKNRRVEVQFKFEESAMNDFDGLLRPGGPEEQ